MWQLWHHHAGPRHSFGLSFSLFCYDVLLCGLGQLIFIRTFHLYTCRHKRSGLVSLDDPVSKLPKLPYTFPLLEADPKGASGEKDEGSFILKATNGCFPGGVYNNEEVTVGPFSATEVLRCRSSLSTAPRTACSFLSRTGNRSYHHRARTSHF